METKIQAGERLARVVFQNRGDHSEVHLKEWELAAILGAAWSSGGNAMLFDLEKKEKVKK